MSESAAVVRSTVSRQTRQRGNLVDVYVCVCVSVCMRVCVQMSCALPSAKAPHYTTGGHPFPSTPHTTRRVSFSCKQPHILNQPPPPPRLLTFALIQNTVATLKGARSCMSKLPSQPKKVRWCVPVVATL